MTALVPVFVCVLLGCTWFCFEFLWGKAQHTGSGLRGTSSAMLSATFSMLGLHQQHEQEAKKPQLYFQTPRRNWQLLTLRKCNF